jgi:transcriptional regulator with XRE-family HTH domain
MKLASDTFGPRLAAIRRNRGLTQAELALAIGVSRQKINVWENGGTAWVDITDVRRCAHALRCRVKDISAPAGTPFPSFDPFLWFRFKLRLQRRLAEKAFGTLVCKVFTVSSLENVKPPPAPRDDPDATQAR